MFSYKVQLPQRVLPTDRPRRLEYDQTVARMVDTEPDFWEKILMTIQAHFTLSGGVNKQNCRIWETENDKIHETSLHDQKVSVWAGVCAKTIIGPFFSKETKQSMEIDIGGCWLIMSAHTCVKKILTVTGFNKTVRHATLQIKQFSFCNENSLYVRCQKEATLSGHPELQI